MFDESFQNVAFGVENRRGASRDEGKQTGERGFFPVGAKADNQPAKINFFWLFGLVYNVESVPFPIWGALI